MRIAGDSVHLTPTEYKLVALLVKHTGKGLEGYRRAIGKQQTEEPSEVRRRAQLLEKESHLFWAQEELFLNPEADDENQVSAQGGPMNNSALQHKTNLQVQDGTGSPMPIPTTRR